MVYFPPCHWEYFEKVIHNGISSDGYDVVMVCICCEDKEINEI